MEKSVWGFSLPLPPTRKMHMYPYIQKCIQNLEGLHLFRYFVVFIRRFFTAELENKSLVLKIVVKHSFPFFKVPGYLCNLTLQERMDALLHKIMEEYNRLKALQTQLMAEYKQVNFYSMEYMSI